MKFRKFIGYRPVMRVLLLLILVTITDTFTISSSSGSCNIDGQPVLWDGENVDMACSIDITGAFELVISKSSPAQNLFTYTLPSTTTIQGDFTGRVSNEVVASTGVSFTVSSFTSTDSSPYTCTPQNTTGGYSTTVDLTGRIFTKPSSSSIPLTTKVDGTTVSDGDTIGQSSDVTINLETSSVSGSPVPTLSVTRDGNSVTCTQTSLTSTARACQATISSTDLQSSSQIVTSAVLCDVSNTISLTSAVTSSSSTAQSTADSMQSTADSVQSTAESAQTTVDSAQTTVDVSTAADFATTSAPSNSTNVSSTNALVFISIPLAVIVIVVIIVIIFALCNQTNPSKKDSDPRMYRQNAFDQYNYMNSVPIMYTSGERMGQGYGGYVGAAYPYGYKVYNSNTVPIQDVYYDNRGYGLPTVQGRW